MLLYAFLVFVCLIPRLSYLFLYPPGDNNVSFYWMLSDSILQYGVLGFEGNKTTQFEPLYPLFLAVARYLTADQALFVFILQIFIAVIGCFFLYRLSFLLSKSKEVGLISSLLYSLYPYFVYQANAAFEITLFTTLLIISSYYYSKANDSKNAVCCGVAFALVVLTRATALPILLLATIALLVRRYYRQALLVIGSAVVVCLPMVVRNYRIDGSLFPSRSGENLLCGNSKYSERVIPAYSLDLLSPYLHDILDREMLNPEQADENQYDKFFTQKAIKFIKENPKAFIRLKVKNMLYLFYPRLVPFYAMSKDSRLIILDEKNVRVENAGKRGALKELTYSFSYIFIFISALIGMYLRKGELRNDLILYLIGFSFIAVYSIYFPTTRLRSPMDFVLMFWSAYAIKALLPNFKLGV